MSNRIFLIEGDYSTSKACVELVKDKKKKTYTPEARASMYYRRMLSSVTAVDDLNLIVTGGLNPSHSKTEHYTIQDDTWHSNGLPELINGRKSHSSCAFDSRFVFIFGGRNVKNQAISSIEKLDFNIMKQGWKQIEVRS